MSEVIPALSFRQRWKPQSIKTKILLALLVMSVLPVILFTVMSGPAIGYVVSYVRSELIRHSSEDLIRSAKNQAALTDAMLNRVAVETRMVARILEGDLAAFAAEKALDPAAASKPDWDRSGNLKKVYAFVQQADPSLQQIYYGTQAGIYHEYPSYQPPNYSVFTFDSAFMRYLNGEGEIPEQLRVVFRKNGVALSRHALVSNVEPGNNWVIRDGETQFSVQRGKTGLDVYWVYDPRHDPWYLNAAGRRSDCGLFPACRVAWTRYSNGSGGGQFEFRLQPGIQITDKVSPSLARAFEKQQIPLIENSPVSIEQGGKWRLQDKNGNDWEIRTEHDELRVYPIDILTSSRAVMDPAGHLAGVVALDIGTHHINLIHTPEDIEGDAFLLNERGELIDQEKEDMFIPNAGGRIRSEMAAGGSGIEYDPHSATYVAYAPIHSFRSPDGKLFGSLGMSLPEGEIMRLAEDTQQRMVLMLELVVGIVFAAIIILAIFAAIRIARGITEPIVELGAGVRRIGGGDLDYRLYVTTRDEIGEVATAFNKMVGDLKIYVRNLATTTAEKERFASELRVAHDIQMSFLKKTFPDRSDFSLFATIVPAREVGGDLYDFDLMDESRLVFYVGDVSDKGIPASLVMAETMTLMRLASQQRGITPAEILRQVNVALATRNENVMFVTLFIGILDLKTGELSFSNAGHNPPVILGANGDSRFLTLPDGLVLGVMPEAEYRDDTVYLEPGDMIVTYTDGVTEAMNPDRRLYSEAHLRETVAALTGRGVRDAVADIVASVRAHAAGAPQSDDIAVLAVRREVSIELAPKRDLSPAAAAVAVSPV